MQDLTPPVDAGPDDPRLNAPAFHRNGAPIVDALTPLLAHVEGEALEIGSGSGQHVALLAHSFPRLTWRPSDPNPAHRASIDAWRAQLKLETVRPALDLDVSREEWPLGGAARAQGFSAVICFNVIHIAPWSVAQGLFRGAADRLAPEGFLALYGPFRWRGRHVSQSNAAFDAGLRARDPDWGVRDVDDLDRLAASCALTRGEAIEMPNNNHMLIFARDAGRTPSAV